jgi:hypothetical protein
MVSVYVSYAWKEEEQNRLVEKLEQACAARGIELLRDRKRIGYGDSIRAFMNEIGAGRHVVLVLSEAYFKSEYCMYELCRIAEHGDVRKRVKPLVLTGTSFHKPADRLRYLKHWETETANLEAELAGLADPKHTLNLRRDLDGYAEFRRRMDELLNVLADMNTLTDEVHLDSDFAALLDRIAPQSAGKPDDLFHARIADEIRRILATSAHLSNALRTTLREAGKEPSSDLSADLCADDLECALEDLLFPATRSSLASLDSRQPEFADTWDAAKSVLAWLGLLAVDATCLEQAARSALEADKLGFEIIVETSLGVELVSSRHRQIAPRLRVPRGTSNVVGDELILEPPYETGWSDDAALDKLVLEIWARVFPEELRSALSANDLRKLNRALRFRDKQKTHHHYIPVPADQASRLCQPGFYRKLLDKLPAITVIFFKSSGGPPALLVSDEYGLMTVIREFLTIPDTLAKRR